MAKQSLAAAGFYLLPIFNSHLKSIIMAKEKGVKIETVVPPAQRRKFKKLCESKGTNMSAQLAKVIAYWTKGMK